MTPASPVAKEEVDGEGADETAASEPNDEDQNGDAERSLDEIIDAYSG